MRSLIVGTAGHIDHGKSALVRALTGTDPDRLKEEKERGITIDLGFAHLDLGDGLVASFIDVPGHERFVRNMLAGAHGIDAVLLVVAADESVMPQTREHFHICRLLGIPRGLVVLTKCDVADADMQALAEMEVARAGGRLVPRRRARAARLGAHGRGAGRAARRPARPGRARRPPRPGGRAAAPPRRPRLHPARVRHRGDGHARLRHAGRWARRWRCCPRGRRARVRGLQVHGAPVERVEAGHRTAVNLAGLEVQDVARGDVLARPGTLRATSIVDVELTLLPAERPLKDEARVRVHIASAEVLARVRVLDGERLAPGATRARPAPPGVAGGGRARRPAGPPLLLARGDHRRARWWLDPLRAARRAAAGAGRRSRARADVAAAAARMVEEAGPAGLEAPTLAARVTVPCPRCSRACRGATTSWRFGRDPVTLVARHRAGRPGARARRRGCATSTAPAASRPACRARSCGGARSRGRPTGVFERVLERLAREGRARVSGDAVALAAHAVRFTPEEARAREALAGGRPRGRAGGRGPGASARRAWARTRGSSSGWAAASSPRAPCAGWATCAGRGGRLDALQAEVRRRWAAGLAAGRGAPSRSMTGLSRKYVIPLLEYLDRERVTRRSGADRFVLS